VFIISEKSFLLNCFILKRKLPPQRSSSITKAPVTLIRKILDSNGRKIMDLLVNDHDLLFLGGKCNRVKNG